MKLKEINITANIAWSPATVNPSYLACGTSAQQLDSSFNSNAQLQIYDLDLANAVLDAKVVASIDTPARFNSIVWGAEGQDGSPNGMIVGGCENAAIYIYDSNKLLAGEEALVSSTEGKHSGPVFSLDLNPFQKNLLACGSSDCEITIFDLNKQSEPMAPGAKPALNADVTCVLWNRMVQHILASSYAGRCVVWDLKKTASIMQISDSVSRMKARSIAWHPNVATQLIMASDDDATPFVQLWDLRYATAPLKTLEGHERGILGMSWCHKDPDLLITTGKDNKTLVWNPNSTDKAGEIVAEFPAYNQWSFDLSWCKRDPTMVALASVDSTVSVYSLLGGGLPPSQGNNKFSAIADSFPGMEMPSVAPQAIQPQPIQLKTPPKWLQKGSGVNFTFGGKLVSWSKNGSCIQVSQVVTEPELVERSSQLEQALAQQDLAPYCQTKVQTAQENSEQKLWQFIGANFSQEPRGQFMELLGHSPTQVSSTLSPPEAVIPDDLSDKMANMATNESSSGSLDPSEQFEMIASTQLEDKTPEPEENQVLEPEIEVSSSIPLDIGEDTQGLITKALLVGDLSSAVELSLRNEQYSNALILANHAGKDLFNKTRDGVLLRLKDGVSSLIGAVVRGDMVPMAQNCSLNSWKEALVAALTYADDTNFQAIADQLGERLEAVGDVSNLESAMVCYICAGSLEKFVSCWLRTREDASTPSTLQDLVEITMILQHSLTAAGRPVNLSQGSTVSTFLCQYASLLAAQGALSTAVSYLSTATEGEMLTLRDRLNRALGSQSGGVAAAAVAQPAAAVAQPAAVAAQPAAPAPASMSALRRSSTPATSFGGPNYGAASSNFMANQFTPSVQEQQRGMFVPQQPMAPQTPNFYNPAAAAPQAPVAQRAPYGQPPMSAFGARSQAAAVPTMTTPPAQPLPAGMSGGLRRSVPNRYVPAEPAAPSASQFNPSMFNPAQATPFQPPPPGPPGPGGMTAPAPVGPPPSGFFDPSASAAVGGYPGQPLPPPPSQPNQPGNPAPTSKPPAAFDSSIPRGWNDPPPPSASRKAKHAAASSTGPAVAPVTFMQPTPGVMAPEQPQQFGGFPSFNPNVAPSPAVAAAAPGEPAAPPEPASKGPLPAEHQVLQDTIEGIRTRCLMTTQNAQYKQRLEDIGRKMETLYDKLRNGQLSAGTLQGVHAVISAIRESDYHRALQTHQQAVATGSFGEMSQFMPSLKMLIQLCMQHNVFLQ